MTDSDATFPNHADQQRRDDAAARELCGPDELADLKQQLAAWDRVGRQLWPYVRYFGLFGGELAAQEAVAELAGLLGLDSAVGASLRAAEVARRQAILDVAEWFRNSPHIRRMAPDAREAAVKAMREIE